GTYTLFVTGNNNASGTVSYSFEAYQNVTTTAALTLGTPVTGALTNPGDQALYTFTRSPGQTLYFEGLNTSYTSRIFAELTNPDALSLFNNDVYYDAGPCTLT